MASMVSAETNNSRQRRPNASVRLKTARTIYGTTSKLATRGVKPVQSRQHAAPFFVSLLANLVS